MDLSLALTSNVKSTHDSGERGALHFDQLCDRQLNYRRLNTREPMTLTSRPHIDCVIIDCIGPRSDWETFRISPLVFKRTIRIPYDGGWWRNVIISAKAFARYYGIAGVGLSVCLFVCLLPR